MVARGLEVCFARLSLATLEYQTLGHLPLVLGWACEQDAVANQQQGEGASAETEGSGCHACRVTKAPKGSAVFDVVGERVYAGVVLERMHAKGTNITSGLVQYADEAGAPAKLTYGPRDLLVRHLSHF